MTIPVELTSGTMDVAVCADAVFELTETFSVDLHTATNASIADSQGIGTILNDDILGIGREPFDIADLMVYAAGSLASQATRSLESVDPAIFSLDHSPTTP